MKTQLKSSSPQPKATVGTMGEDGLPSKATRFLDEFVPNADGIAAMGARRAIEEERQADNAGADVGRHRQWIRLGAVLQCRMLRQVRAVPSARLDAL